jgi:small subunit ribosomal protein S8
MSHDVVSDALCKIMNAKNSNKKEIFISNYSEFLIEVLKLAKQNGYIENYSLDAIDKKIKIILGKLNECSAIKPRFEVQAKEIDKYIRRYLPARNFGIIIISTSQGLMTHYEALEKNKGGSLIAYFY